MKTGFGRCPMSSKALLIIPILSHLVKVHGKVGFMSCFVDHLLNIEKIPKNPFSSKPKTVSTATAARSSLGTKLE